VRIALGASALVVLALAGCVPAAAAARAGATTNSGATTSTAAGVVAPPPGSACGKTIDVPARRSLGLGPAPLAIGDSVLYDAAQPLSEYGFHVNAMVCRTMAQGIVWLEMHGRNLPVLVVVALGTNGAVTGGQIAQLLGILGPHRFLALVTPHDGNYGYVPGLIRAAARRYPDRIELLDWDRFSAGHPDWFAADSIHLGGSAGIDAYTRLVTSALLGPSTPTAPATSATPSTTIQPSAPRPARPVRRTPANASRPSREAVTGALVGLAAAEAICLSLVDD
jgi:hypothetical protein